MTDVASLELCKELRICDIVDCERPHEARGMCRLHYKRWKNHGDPLVTYPNKYKHGGTGTKEFHAWSSMRDRTGNLNNPNFKHYGGRGIIVCPEWKDFETFLADMGKAPSPQHSIERLDNNGDYRPGNCVWADKKTQGNNTRRNKFLTFRDKTQTIAQWSDELNIKYATLYARISRGWSTERALSWK